MRPLRETANWILFAGNFVGQMASRIVKLPENLTTTSEDFSRLERDNVLLESFQRIPNSIDNMSPGHPFIQNLSSIPISEEVIAHSIIAVKGEGPLKEEGDGVVKYKSAHIDGVASEKVVQSGHSTQSHPNTIEEVRRILLEHLDEALITNKISLEQNDHQIKGMSDLRNTPTG